MAAFRNARSRYEPMSTSSSSATAFRMEKTRDCGFARAWLTERFGEHQLCYDRKASDFDFMHLSAPVREGTVNLLQYGARIEIDPERFGDFYMLEVPLEGGVDLETTKGRTHSTDPGCALFIPPQLRFLSTWRRGTRQFMLKLNARDVQGRWRALTGDPAAHLPAISPRIDFSTHEGWRVQEMMRLLRLEFERGLDGNSRTVAASPISGAVLDSVLEYIRVRHAADVSPADRTALPAALHRTLAFMDRNLARDIRMADLVEISGVSERSLFNIFSEFLDTSPMRCLEVRRLKQARKHLLEGRGTVSGIAIAAGFRHMGRFSKSYRQTFGEHPSQTLAGCRRPYPDTEDSSGGRF